MSSKLSCESKKVISEASAFVKSEIKSQEKSIAEFKKKQSFGLWWDAKGFWNYSDKDVVMTNMGIYSKLYEDVLTCTEEIVTKEDEIGYQRLLHLYKKIEELERDAKIHATGDSKALCQVAKSFLDNHPKLDSKLKRVECSLLDEDLKKSKEEINNLTEDINNTKNYIQQFKKDNEDFGKLVRELKEENLDFKKTVRSLRRENQELKDSMSEFKAKAEIRLQEMMEENRRTTQRMMIEILENKIGEEKAK